MSFLASTAEPDSIGYQPPKCALGYLPQREGQPIMPDYVPSSTVARMPHRSLAGSEIAV
jgi:hypothetical protein